MGSPVKWDTSGRRENLPYSHVLCYPSLRQSCVAHHVDQAVFSFKQEVKPETSDAGHRTKG